MSGHVLGIDPSLTATAVASSVGWVEITGAKGKADATYPDRLARINKAYAAIMGLIKPGTELVVIEGPAYSRVNGGAWDRAFLWWLIYRHCAYQEIPVAVVPPNLRAQYATGKGNGSKGAVIDAVARRWPGYGTGGDDNAADAVVLMAMGLDKLGTPISIMPVSHRRALDKVEWPVATLPGMEQQ